MDITTRQRLFAIIGFLILLIAGGTILFNNNRPVHPLIQKILIHEN